MREIVYEFAERGMYVTEQNTAFLDDKELKIIVKPHSFSLSVGGDNLRKSSCEGCEIIVSKEGEVSFLDNSGKAIASVSKSDNEFSEVRLDWKQNYLTVLFGKEQTVDNYPNCDGESDRYSVKWVTDRAVTLNQLDNTVETK